MKLPFLSHVNAESEIYCGVLLKEAHGTCFLFRHNVNSLSLLKQKQFQYSDGWEHIVDDADEALSLLEQEHGEGTAKKCIFFIFSHLVDKQTRDIAKPYITKMKEMAVSLEMKPLGYLEVVDAVHEYIEKQKQIRLSSIVIEVDDTQITLFVFVGGHKLESHTVQRTGVFCDDVEAALEDVEQKVLPNHIYMYNSTDLAEESSDLLMHAWKKEFFTQQPRIDILSKSMIDTALHQLLEKQLCGQVVSATIEDVPKKQEVLGFVVGKDVSEEQAAPYVHPSVLPKQKDKKPLFSSIKFPKLHVPYLVIGVSLLLFSSLVFGTMYFFHKAIVTLRSPKLSRQALTTVIASEESTDDSLAKLDSKLKTFSYKEKKETTGKRDIGEKAAGEVTLYSYDDKEKQIAKGTKVQTGSVTFETSEQVQVPSSQFASDGITKNPGKAKVKVQASLIGNEGNIEKNNRFTIGDNASSILFGINEASFAGGTKKTIRTVSSADSDALKNILIEKAKKEGLGEKSDKERLVVSELSKVALSKEQFSAEVGEEASTLTLSATAEVTTYSIATRSIEAVIRQELEKQKPSGYQAEHVTFVVKNQKRSGKANIELSIEGKADFSRIIDDKKLIEKLVGISTQNVKKVVGEYLDIEDSETVIMPNIPLLNAYMPFWANHIQIKIIQ